MNIDETRRRFLQQLRTMPVREVRHLLGIETEDELRALRDACFPDGDEAMRCLVGEFLPKWTGYSNANKENA